MDNNPVKSPPNRRIRWIIGIGALLIILVAAIPWGKTTDKLHANLAKNSARIANAITAARQKVVVNSKDCTDLNPLLSQSSTELTPPIKDAAIQQIKDCQQPLISDLTAKYKVVQEERRS